MGIKKDKPHSSFHLFPMEKNAKYTRVFVVKNSSKNVMI